MMIGILEAGRPPGTLQQQYGSYADMVRAMLGPMPGLGHAIRVFDVQAGALPSETEACTAYVVTGSSAGVYDDLPWIARLIGFLQQARGRARLAGICFGHQAIAEAFGGRVEKSPKGWGLGLHRYEVVTGGRWLGGAGEVAVPAFHQDQVVAPPPGAVVLARSAFTPFAALSYGTDAITIQSHPEFSNRFSAALVDAQRHIYGDAAGPALQSLQEPSDAARVGATIGGFLLDERAIRRALP